LDRDDQFAEDRQRLIAQYPRLSGVFEVTERELETIPGYRGVDLGNSYWLHVTERARDAPPLVFFYAVRDASRTVWLGGVDVNE
jgi:hypothetical protein